MEIKKIPKSQLLKNVSIEQKNQCDKQSSLCNNNPIKVREHNNQYYVEEGLEEILSMDESKNGDDLIKCYII
ncbi:MAG: hypothetical protein ACLSV2_05200 [Clostridium sp.]